MARAVARAYNGGLGAEPPAGSRGRAPSGESGAKPPEAEALLVFGHLMEATNLPTFQKFGNAKKSDICVFFEKKLGWPRNWGRGLEQNRRRGLGPGLKPPLRSSRWACLA